jgi:hypothetical protein
LSGGDRAESSSERPARGRASEQLKLSDDELFETLQIARMGPSVGRGMSQAKTAVGMDGSEYMIKGPSLSASYPFVAACEYIAGRMAARIGLPVLNSRFLQKDGDTFWGSEYIPDGKTYGSVSKELFYQCLNRDDCYKLVMFDTWMCNCDRYHDNLIIRTIKPAVKKAFYGEGPYPDDANQLLYNLLPNDHSHCLIGRCSTGRKIASTLKTLESEGLKDVLQLDFITEYITDYSKVLGAVDLIGRVSDRHIETVVESIPFALLDGQYRSAVSKFISVRRDRMQMLLQDGLRYFPNLGADLP